MIWDGDEHTLYLLHSCLAVRWPVVIDWQQTRIALGIACPRHRAILKARLGWFGRWLPDREWTVDDNGRDVLVSAGGWTGRRR